MIQQQPSKCRDGSQNGVVGEVGLGHGVSWGKLHNLIMADDNLPVKFHLDPFSLFAGIHVSVQFGAKTQRLVTFRGKFWGELVKRRQPRLALWVGEGWGYHVADSGGFVHWRIQELSLGGAHGEHGSASL